MSVLDPDILARARKINSELASLGTDLGLAAAGMAPPPFGTAADVVSLGKDTYGALAGTGSWWDVAFSAVGFVPIFGDAAKGGRVIKKVGRLADEAAEIAGELAKMGPEGAKVLDEMGGALGGLKKAGCDTLGIKQICAALSKVDEAKAAGKADEGAQAAASSARQSDDLAKGGTDLAKEVEIPRSKYPETAKHIEDAQKSGHPDILTVDRQGASGRRADSLKGHDKVPGKQLDEYPPAMFKEGGKGASVRPVKPADNMGAGACLGNQCRGVNDGQKIRIKVTE